MVGRMALNNPWKIGLMDEAFFGVNPNKNMTREQIILDYANWLQNEQDQFSYISNTTAVKPIVNIFAGEWMGAEFRKFVNESASKPQYKGKVKQVIIDAVEYYRKINAEGLSCKIGEFIIRPDEIIERDLLDKLEKFGTLKPDDEIKLKNV